MGRKAAVWLAGAGLIGWGGVVGWRAVPPPANQVASPAQDQITITAAAEETEEGATAAAGGGDSAKADYRDESVPVQDRLVKVTTYSDRAELTRQGKVKLRAGPQWLEFREISSQFIASTVRVEADPGFSGRIVQVVGEEVFAKGILRAQTRAKIDELRKLYAELLAQTQKQRAIENELAFVQDLKFDTPFQRSPASTIYRPFSAKIDTLRSSMDEIQAKSGDLLQKSENLKAGISQINDRIVKVQGDLQTQSSMRDQDWKTRFFVLVDAKAAQETTVTLRYQASNALWRPIYDLRAELDRKNGTADIKLVTAGMVEQKTGEDWKQVELTLSSLDPVPLYLPKLRRWVLKENRSEAPMPARKAKANYADYRQKVASRLEAKRDQLALNEEGAVKQRAKKAEIDGSDSDAPAAVEPAQKPASLAAPTVVDALMKDKERRLNAPAEQEALLTSSDESDVGGMSAGGFAGNAVNNKRSHAGEKGKVSGYGGGGPRFARGRISGNEQNRDPAGMFTLEPLENLYPELGNYTRAVAEADRNQKVQLLDAKLAASRPERINYSDSRLPAVQANGRLIEFTSPFPVDVSTDVTPLKVPVQTQSLQGKLSYYTVPKMDARVFLRAETTNTTDRPILGGAAQVFMDGDLVSKTELDTISERSFFQVDLGVDRNVETKRIVNRKAKTAGILRSTHTTEVEVNIEIANHHPFAIDMEVRDNYPKAPNDKIEASLQKVEPDVQKDEKAYGVIIWHLQVPPKSRKTLSFVYEVSHPESYLVSEFN